MTNFLSLLDLLALAIFFLCWVGYSVVADRVPSVRRRSVITAMDAHRLRWMVSLLPKENRVADVSIIGNLMSSTSFLANTCIFIVGGLLALLASPDVGRRVLAAMPFAEPSLSDGGWEARVLLLLLIFVRTFFELTWALRQFNYGSILVGGLERSATALQAAAVAAKVLNRAARHFNTGLRAYYFGLAALAWILHPLALIGASLWVLWELQRREFRSAVRDAVWERPGD